MSRKKEYPRFEIRGDFYYIQDYVNGRFISRTTKQIFEEEAQKCLKDYILQQQTKLQTNNITIQNSSIIIFDKLALMFLQDKERSCKPKTHNLYSYLVDTIIPFFSGKDMNSIKRIDIKQFEDLEKLNGISDGLLCKKLGILQAIFNY